VNDVDPFGLAGRQETDHLYVHERHARHVKHNPRSQAVDLHFQFLDVLRSNSANQPEDGAFSIRARLDSQRHAAGLVSGQCKVDATYKQLNPLLVDGTIRARFQQLLIFGMVARHFALVGGTAYISRFVQERIPGGSLGRLETVFVDAEIIDL
jgi:hypothetical protein